MKIECIEKDGTTTYKTIAQISARIVEDQEAVIMATVDEALGDTEYTIDKKKLVDLLDRDNEKEIFFDREYYARCPRCNNSIKKHFDIHFCDECGQRITF